MDAVYLTLFVSSVLAVLGVVLFVWTHREGSRDHTDRLALMPLEDDTGSSSPIPETHPQPPGQPGLARPTGELAKDRP